MAKNNSSSTAFDWSDLEKKKTSDLKEVSTDAKYFKFTECDEGDIVNMKVTGMKSFKKDGKDVETVCFETREGAFVNGSALLVRAVRDLKKEFPFFLRVIYKGAIDTDNGEMDSLQIFEL